MTWLDWFEIAAVVSAFAASVFEFRADWRRHRSFMAEWRRQDEWYR